MKDNYLPPLSYVRNSLKRSSKEYLLENSLHGVSYFADPKRPKWERGLWFLLTMSSIIASIITIIIIWDKFQNNPTLTELEAHVTDAKIPFPIIFLCFEGNQLNVNNLEKKFYEKIYEWRWNEKINEQTKETLSGVTNFRDVFKRLTPRCDSILSNAIFILYIADKFDVGPSRYVMPHIKLRKPASMYLDVFQTYVTSDFQMLSDFQRQCHYRKKQWSYNGCRLRCWMKYVSKKCNCLPWFLIKKGVKECSLDEYSCLTKVYDNKLYTNGCTCILPCNFTVYRLSGTKEGFENDTLNSSPTIIIFNWPVVLFRREVRFGYMDLVVSFGGIAGLFLGYSLISSFEFFYYLTFRTYCGAVLDSSQKNRNIFEVRPKKVPFSDRLLTTDIKFISYNNFEQDRIFNSYK